MTSPRVLHECLFGRTGGMASCPRLGREERENLWASGFRQTSDFEMNIRRGVGVSLLVCSLSVAYWLRGFDGGWNVKYEEVNQVGMSTLWMNQRPTVETLMKSSLLCSLSGAAVMLWVMGELSQ